jgi:hypothetical protein
MKTKNSFERTNPYDLNHVSKVDRYSSLVDRTRAPSKDPYITVPQNPNESIPQPTRYPAKKK